MVINDELLACYVEGKCTPSEKMAVRQYLSKHPEEIIHLVSLMDTYKRMSKEEIFGNQQSSYGIDSVSDIAMSAAAFAPMSPSKGNCPKTENCSKETEYLRRAKGLLNAIENL